MHGRTRLYSIVHAERFKFQNTDLKQKCAESWFLDSYSAPASRVLTHAPGVNPHLRNLIEKADTLLFCIL